METVSGKGRKIWSPEEDSFLLEIIERESDWTWKERAEELKRRCNSCKTSKQCRERFRNYLNPQLECRKWKPHEKLVFMLLHALHGNQWCRIAEKMNRKSDLKLKNFFYSIMRKALRMLKHKTLPLPILHNSDKMFRIILALELIRKEYVPYSQNETALPRKESKEQIIVQLMKKRKITEESIAEYEERLKEKYREKRRLRSFPELIEIDLKLLNLNPETIKELTSGLFKLLPPSLSDTIRIQFKQREAETPAEPQQIPHIPAQVSIFNYSPTFCLPNSAQPSLFPRTTPNFYSSVSSQFPLSFITHSGLRVVFPSSYSMTYY